jgi:uncharacterized membrane protein
MSDVQGAGAAQDNGSSANLIYILYLVGLVTGGITALVGVIMAYMYRGSAPAWVQSHYQFQIRTFWIWLLGGVVGWVLTSVLMFAGPLFFIGILFFLALFIWYIVRCVKGMQYVGRREAYPNPVTWVW